MKYTRFIYWKICLRFDFYHIRFSFDLKWSVSYVVSDDNSIITLSYIYLQMRFSWSIDTISERQNSVLSGSISRNQYRDIRIANRRSYDRMTRNVINWIINNNTEYFFQSTPIKTKNHSVTKDMIIRGWSLTKSASRRHLRFKKWTRIWTHSNHNLKTW